MVLYRSIFDVVRDFLHEEAIDEEGKVLARYLKPELLIIDDMGMKQLPRRSGEVLFEIILRRYETRSTIMTSNRPLEDWGKLLADVPKRHGDPRPLPVSRRGDLHHRPQLPPAEPGGHRGGACYGVRVGRATTSQRADCGSRVRTPKTGPTTRDHRVNVLEFGSYRSYRFGGSSR